MHVLVAGYLGYQAPRRVGATTEMAGEVASMLGDTPVVRGTAVDDSAWRAALASTPTTVVH